MENVLVTSTRKQLSLAINIIKQIKRIDAEAMVFTCDMDPESISDIVGSDGCFNVPMCTSEDYVETIFSICLGYDISHIITMTDREFIILSANKDLFAKYGIQIDEFKSKVSLEDIRTCQ